MLRQWNMKLMTVSFVVLSLGLVGCSAEDKQASAENANASSKSSEDQNTDKATVSAADPADTDENPADEASETPTTIDLASLTGDAANGKRVFGKCMACHTMEAGQNRVGPSLFEIVGKPAGSVAGFKYSPAMTESGVVWNDEALHDYLKNPKAFMPRNRMMFPGVPSAQDRADVIAFLQAPPE